MSIPQPIHPFPARMAPSIALSTVQNLRRGSVVLDPMMGSGTVIRAAIAHGHRAIGRDVDPLAVLMSRVWTTPTQTHTVLACAERCVQAAQSLPADAIMLPWIDNDAETQAFVDYWFGPLQRDALRRLSVVLYPLSDPVSDLLRLALSRTIITKDHGASLARDVSHSRPHRAFTDNTYPVYEGFLQAVQRLVNRLELEPPTPGADVRLGDARQLTLADESVDAVITSPPYLNAIDYLRGHRLALVWLGHQIRALRTIRAESIGAERAPDHTDQQARTSAVMRRMGLRDQLPARETHMIERYIIDLSRMLAEIYRTLRPRGKAVFVLGNSCIRGVFVKNSVAVSTLARELGFELLHRSSRPLPESRRYLPPPTPGITNDMSRRMRTEIVLTYLRP